MRILLDTNAYSALPRGHDEVADRVRRAEQVVFSTVVAGELRFGFRLGARLKKNTADSDERHLDRCPRHGSGPPLSFDAHFGAIDGLAWIALSPA